MPTRRSESPRESTEDSVAVRWWTVFATFLLHRLFVFGIATLSFQQGQLGSNQWNRWFDGGAAAQTLGGVLSNWDAQHYLLLAARGYEAVGQHHWAFYPLLPWAIAGASTLTSSLHLAGHLVVAVATLVFLVYLSKYASKVCDSQKTLWVLAIVMSHPAAFFLGAIYSEALFLALLFAWLWHYEERQYWALIPASLLAVTRGHAFFVLVAFLAALAWKWFRGREAPGWFDWANVAAMAVGAAGYFGFFYWQLGDATAGLGAQDTFVFGNSLGALFNPRHFVEYVLSPTAGWYAVTNGLLDKITIMVMLAGIFVVARLPGLLPVLLYVALTYFPAAMGSGGSYLRFSLIPMPLLAIALTSRSRRPGGTGRLWVVLIAAGLALQAVNIWRFSLNEWVG